MKTIAKPFIVMLAVMMILMTGCGQNAGSKETGAKPEASAAGAASPSASAGTAVKSVKHAMGTSEIKGTPKRIVALEWTYAEDLLALGVQPVGVADIKGFKAWVITQPALDAGATDVGTRQEPNLEAIAALKPDLIIAANFRVKNSYEKLNQIAPTLAFESYPQEGTVDQYTEMEQTFKTIADLTGKTAEADKVLQDLHKTYEDAKAKLKAAGKEGREVVLSMAYSNQNAAAMRLFTDNSMAVQILQRIGLKNAFKPSKFELYGYSTTSVEALPAVQQADFLYVVQKEDNVFEKQLKDNAVWNGLGFVKEKRTYALSSSTWLFGGPVSAKGFVEQVVKLYNP